MDLVIEVKDKQTYALVYKTTFNQSQFEKVVNDLHLTSDNQEYAVNMYNYLLYTMVTCDLENVILKDNEPTSFYSLFENIFYNEFAKNCNINNKYDFYIEYSLREIL